MPPDEWAAVQQRIVREKAWILDGDLGPYDEVEIRLRAADTVIFLDFTLLRCTWRALRRSREGMDFWVWLICYRYRSRPFLMRMISKHASSAQVHILKNPNSLANFLRDLEFKCGRLPLGS